MMKPKTVKEREDMIARLSDDMAETIEQWALHDVGSLVAYVREAEGFDKLTDEELGDLYIERFDIPEDEDDEE